MMRIALLAVSAIALAASPISAAVAADDLAGTYDWTGSYIGLNGGYSWFSTHYEDVDYLSDPDPSGLLGGIYLGYNRQLNNNLVLGIDADIGVSNAKGTGGQCYDDDPSVCIAGVNAPAKVHWEGAVRGRIGYAFDRFLPYVAGGLSIAKQDFHFYDSTNGLTHPMQDRTYTGWNIGAGIDWAVSGPFVVRAEYRYTDFGKHKFYTDFAGDAEIRLKSQELRLGVAYKF